MIDEKANPIELFGQWFEEASKTESADPNAMTVATVGADGMPNARILLLKGRAGDGFIFYTNLTSVKAQELEAQRKAALVFHWKTQKRQIRIQGSVEQVADSVADAYFASRPRQSQLGAWASDQSKPLADRETFEARLEDMDRRFDQQDVPRPDHWSGFCLTPSAMEFWQDREFRLHDRVRFERQGGSWSGQRLYP